MRSVIDNIITNAETRMTKSVDSLQTVLKQIRTGRAHTSILDWVKVEYYGEKISLSKVANINIEDARTLTVVPWEKQMVRNIEKAIITADLGLTTTTAGNVIRVPMAPITEETRRNYLRQARAETETSKVAVRNVRRDANHEVKSLLKNKNITEDEAIQSEDAIQKLTNKYICNIDKILEQKENDLLQF